VIADRLTRTCPSPPARHPQGGIDPAPGSPDRTYANTNKAPPCGRLGGPGGAGPFPSRVLATLSHGPAASPTPARDRTRSRRGSRTTPEHQQASTVIASVSGSPAQVGARRAPPIGGTGWLGRPESPGRAPTVRVCGASPKAREPRSVKPVGGWERVTGPVRTRRSASATQTEASSSAWSPPSSKPLCASIVPTRAWLGHRPLRDRIAENGWDAERLSSGTATRWRGGVRTSRKMHSKMHSTH